MTDRSLKGWKPEHTTLSPRAQQAGVRELRNPYWGLSDFARVCAIQAAIEQATRDDAEQQRVARHEALTLVANVLGRWDQLDDYSVTDATNDLLAGLRLIPQEAAPASDRHDQRR
jgi:hypothetical protein